MAKNETVWGIDVGNTSLKALRCRRGAEPGTIEVLQFDYIEHSKILTQPGADANEILAETLSQFLSRNDVRGEKVAISVSGQNALWRFQPLPPIDPKKVNDLIKYEVKQWLPFDLQDVIWDYRKVGGVEEGGIAVDMHIFMYAMKREVAKRTLDKYSSAGINVDCIQGAQVALYNAFVHDLYNYDELLEQDINSLEDFDVILNVGTDATEIVVTNGVVVWLRNIPVGGNLFTKALTKSLKLTFSNAEHTKRNANSAPDPKAVILAMKPVFGDMLSEIDRSIKYYCGLNKRAKIRRVYALGNAMKLPGLRQFLSKSLGYDVVTVNSFRKLVGAETLGNKLFVDNASSFGVAYGLALQLLGEAPLNINLVPRDVVQDRLIEAKKPWTLAAASLIALGLGVQYFVTTSTYNVVQNPALESAQKTAEGVADKSSKLISKANAAVTEFQKFDNIGRNLTSGVEGRITWMELLKAINSVIPAEAPNSAILSDGVTGAKIEAIKAQNRIYIDNIEVQDVEELDDWFELVRKWYYIDDVEAQAFEIDAAGNEIQPDPSQTPATGADEVSTASASSSSSSSTENKYTPPFTLEEMFPFVPASDTKGGAGTKSSSSKSSSSTSKTLTSSKSSTSKSSTSTKSSTSKSSSSSSKSSTSADVAALNEFTQSGDARLELIPAPSGPGRIVQLSGYHYHNPTNVDDPARGAEYLRRTILYNLKHGSIELPISLDRQRNGETGTETVKLSDMGIYYPVHVDPGAIDDNFRLLDPKAAAEARKKILESQVKVRREGRTGGSNMGAGRMAGGAGSGSSMGTGAMGGGRSGGMSSGMGSGMSSMNNQIAGQLSSDKILNLSRYDFVIQFVWMETPPSTRDERRKAAEEAKKAEEEGNSSSSSSEDEVLTPTADTTTPADPNAAPADTTTPADPNAAPADTTTPADPNAAPADTTTPADPNAAPADTTTPVDPNAAPAP